MAAGRASQALKQGARLRVLDAVRGLAVLLMILDHGLVLLLVADIGPHRLERALRLSVTRGSLPLFMLCSGVLLAVKLPGWRRLVEVGVIAVAVNGMLWLYPFGIRPPEVLAVWVAVMCAAPLIRRFPVAVACVGAVQVSFWPIPWHGYQPGLLALLLAVGVLAGPSCVAWGWRLPSFLDVIGRRPLTWYCAHLGVLCALSVVLL